MQMWHARQAATFYNKAAKPCATYTNFLYLTKNAYFYTKIKSS